MNRSLLGVLLFLPVPLVLLLFTRYPLGVPISVGLGVLLVATHRLYARPFALRNAGARCLWCARRVNHPWPLEIDEPGGGHAWATCSETHRTRLRSFLGWAQRRGLFLRIGILGGLAIFLPLLLVSHRGALGSWSPSDSSALFRGVIALTVLPLGWLGLRAEPEARPRVPFPVHIQALIGSFWVMILFRVVGIVWLAGALWHFYRRFVS